MNGPYKALVGLAAVAVIVPAAQARPAAASQLARTAIAAVLNDSASGWNTGDLDHFMSCYEKAAGTTYVSGGKLVSGYDAIRAAYATRFAGGTADLGKLALSILDFRMIDADHAYVVGRFQLHRTGPAGDVEGLTTLLFRRTAAGWRIVADHS